MTTGRIKRIYQVGKSVISIGLIVYQSAQEIIKLKNRINKVRQKDLKNTSKPNIKNNF